MRACWKGEHSVIQALLPYVRVYDLNMKNKVRMSTVHVQLLLETDSDAVVT